MSSTIIDDRGIRLLDETRVSWSDMADAVACASSKGQAEFFEHLAIRLAGAKYGPGKWAMQCRAIADDPGWLPLNRERIASQLETLAQHMRERVS